MFTAADPITHRRDPLRVELARVKSTLAIIAVLGLDEESAHAYRAIERSIENEIVEHERETGVALP